MKRRKRALINSIISLILCVSMLMGTTFAWFTDSVTSGINQIVAGNLDVELYHSNAKVINEKVNASTKLFMDLDGNPILWEPGVVSYENLHVTNEGDLALVYQMAMSTANENYIVDTENNVKYGLSQILKVGVVENGVTATDRRGVVKSVNEGDWTTLAGFVQRGTLLPEDGKSEKTIGVVIWWEPGDNDNRWNLNNGKKLSDNSEALNIDLGIQLIATQEENESDSFGSDYDVEAETDTFPVVPSSSATVTVTPNTENKTTDTITMNGGQVTATIPAGVQLAEGTTELTMSVSEMNESDAKIKLGENEESRSLNVHIEGVDKNNTVPMIIDLGVVMPTGLNMGNYKLYHVENGVTKEMTYVNTEAEVDAHNEFYYDPATGRVVVAMATFSELTLVADTVNAWGGNADYSWYSEDLEELIIANGDQLYAFAQIVGGMAKDKDDNVIQDSFSGQTVKLVNDINLADDEDHNVSNKIFYPIGYYNNNRNYDKVPGGTVTSDVNSFEGTFDGTGHTIANFYQNTWEMFGDYNDGYAGTPNHYNDAMGLFGYVNGGTVKNLTVDNFSSDGEFTPTGVIAAYADGDATFENIAITNCNPRVYNTGNGGIIGIAGSTSAENDDHITLKNITVDNSNKISALWGSWDVACGGLVGMYRGNVDSSGKATGDTISFENCHVAAQIDVYNDVCANYQYYAYRYAGMIIGSIRHNKNENGNSIPDMTSITANNCTVHFGDWNDYYYCELVANTKASYTHDHQFSRLEQVKEISDDDIITYLDETTGTVPASGRYNYVVVDGGHDTNNATCYHFVNGEAWKHDEAGIETVDGVEVKVEDKQHIYLEFDQLFTGYGWGVSSKGITDFAGVKNMDITAGDYDESVEKFTSTVTELANNAEIKLDKIFTLTNEGAKLVPGALTVTVTNLDDTNPVSAVFTRDAENWENGTLKLTGTGTVTITIQDYYFCTPTTITVEVKNADDITETERFEILFPNTETYLYRVGNQNAVPLNKLFGIVEGQDRYVGNISVTVDPITGASGYPSNATAAALDTDSIQFSGTGVVKVTISDNNFSKPRSLYLEVVDAENVVTATSATNNNVVLLNDVNGASNIKISNNYNFYGNGFTLTYTGDGSYSSKDLKRGFIEIETGGQLENTRVKCNVFPEAYIYTSEMTAEPYAYQFSAVMISGDSRITNCYIYGARNNICVGAGNVTISDTITECGSLSNIQIDKNSSNAYTVTLHNVTTIQYQVQDSFNKGKNMLGVGVMVGTNESTSNANIHLTGTFKQYNWVDADDATAVSNEMAKAIINAALSKTDYIHTVDGKDSANLGIIYLNQLGESVKNDTGLPYVFSDISMNVTLNGMSGTAKGRVYALSGAAENQIVSDTESADRTTVNGYYEPQFKFDDDLSGQYVAETTDCDEFCYQESGTVKVMFPEGDTKALDLAGLVNITKYTGQDLNLEITCEDSDGSNVTVTGGKIILDKQMDYTVTYSVTDTLFFDKNANPVTNTATYSWNVPITVSVKDKGTPNAYFQFDKSKQVIYYSGNSLIGYTQFIPFIAGLSIYDYEEGSDKATLRFDGSDTTNGYNKIKSVSINNVNTTGEAQGYHIVTVELNDGGKLVVDMDVRATSGGSTHTGSIKVDNDVVYVVNDGTTSVKGQQWKIYSYKFTGNNGVEIDSGAITFGTSGTDAESNTKPTGTFGESNSSGSGCFAEGTMITLIDGTQKPIEQISYEDELLTWDFNIGAYAVTTPSLIESHETGEYRVLNLKFADETVARVIVDHGFFDVEENNFVFIDEENVDSYVNHQFVKVGANGTYENVELIGYEMTEEVVSYYTIQTAVYNNCIAENMFTLTSPPELLENDGWFDYFEIGDGMKYDEEKKQADIDKYGLYTYEDFAEYVTYEQFIAFNGPYLKILVGRGIVTYGQILELIAAYVNN